MYYVYVLLSLKDKKLYIGFTSDLRRRLKEHNAGSMHKRKIIKRQILDKIESLSNEVVAFYDKRVKSARELRNL